MNWGNDPLPYSRHPLGRTQVAASMPGYAPLRDPLLILTESIQVVFAVFKVQTAFCERSLARSHGIDVTCLLQFIQA